METGRRFSANAALQIPKVARNPETAMNCLISSLGKRLWKQSAPWPGTDLMTTDNWVRQPAMCRGSTLIGSGADYPTPHS